MRSGFVLIFALLLAACSPGAGASDSLNVVAINPILGDVVSQVGGEQVQVTVLIPAGTDPHAFEVTPQDAAKIAEADLVVINGLGLEASLEAFLHDAEEAGRVVVASEGVVPLEFEDAHEHEDEHEHEGEEHDHEGEEHDHEDEEHDHHHEGEDPHVWMNPLNVITWVDNIAAALTAADAANAAAYQANAEAYKASLTELDDWITQQVAEVPVNSRQLVTDHESFNYFAQRYGFEIVGALIPSFSTLSEISAGELAELEETITAHNVPAIFVGASINPSLAERVSTDTGVALVILYGETLSASDGPAPNYIEMMNYNVSSIVDALR